MMTRESSPSNARPAWTMTAGEFWPPQGVRLPNASLDQVLKSIRPVSATSRSTIVSAGGRSYWATISNGSLANPSIASEGIQEIDVTDDSIRTGLPATQPQKSL